MEDPWYNFDGAKLALIAGGRVLTKLRDDKTDIPFPNMWDLPGGGREGDESPVSCVLRETKEEFGLTLAPDILTYRRYLPGVLPGQGLIWFFGAVIEQFDAGRIRFGIEGQRWQMMPVAAFVKHPQAVPHLKKHLNLFLAHLRPSK